MIGQISFKSKWSFTLRSLILLTLFVFLPFVVLLLCLILGFVVNWEILTKCCFNGRFWKQLRQRDIFSIHRMSRVGRAVISSLKLVFFSILLIIFGSLYISLSLITAAISYAILLPLFYIYFVLIFIRQLIVWSGKRAAKSAEFKKLNNSTTPNLPLENDT